MKMARNLKIGATIILGLVVLFWTIQGIAGSVRETAGAANNYIQAAIAAFLALLSWYRPLPGGILQVLAGVVSAMYFLLVYYSIYEILPFLALFCAPLGVAGLISVEAAWRIKKQDITHS